MSGTPRRLRIAFEEAAAFRAEYERNLIKGGIFIQAKEPFQLRELVEVDLALDFCGESVVLEAEVVHCVDAGQSGSGVGGVAVQFSASASEIRERLEHFTDGEENADVQSLEHSRRGMFGDEDISGLDLEESRGEAQVFDPSEVDLSGDRPHPDTAADEAERRKAERAPARLQARVDAQGMSLGGRTRDLSEAGVLVSADASDLPIGKRVALELVHPVSGESMAVEGTVARHVETEGTVAAVAIEFSSDAPSTGVEAFVKSVREFEADQRRRGIFGAVEELGAERLVRMFGSAAEQGTLSVVSGQEEATICFEKQTLRHAQLGELQGVKALARVFSWQHGCFEFHARLDPGLPEAEPIALGEAIAEAREQCAERMRSGLVESLDPAAHFRVDRQKLLAGGVLTQTQEAVLDLVAAGFSVRRIIDVIPESDAEVAEALAQLKQRGIILPA